MSYCFESCSREEAVMAPGDRPDPTLPFYWVRTRLGTIDLWLERQTLPDGVEYVRPVESTGKFIQYVPCTKEESLHPIFDSGPLVLVYVYAGGCVQRWMADTSNPDEFAEHGWLFVRPVETAR